MKRIRFLVLFMIIVSILATNIVVSADSIGSNGNEDKGCAHTYEFGIIQEYHGDYDGKCKISIIESDTCTKCGHEIVLLERTILVDHVSFIFKASCDRATHIYYCKCRCGKGMPTIREACPRPGVGCPDMLSLGRWIDMPY